MMSQFASFLPLRWLLTALLSLVWTTMTSAAFLAARGEFDHCTLAAKGADAAAALRSKLSALENAQQTAARTRTLPDGSARITGTE